MGVVNWYLNWCDRWMPGYSRPDAKEEPPEEAPCARCGGVIDYDVTECPECGNRPVDTVKWNSIKFMLTGVLLSITVVGAIIGIPLIIVGVVMRLGMGPTDYSPTEHDF